MKKYLLVLLLACLMVGTVSADTAIVYSSTEAGMYSTATVTGGNADPAFYVARRVTSASDITINGSAFYSMQVWNRSIASWVYVYRDGQVYNTSIVGSGTINSAKIRLAGFSDGNGMGNLGGTIADWAPANINSPVSGDWDATTFALLSSTNITPASHGAVNNYTLNAAGLLKINKTGKSAFLFMGTNDIDNTTTGITWIVDGSTSIRDHGAGAAVANRPMMIIEYTPGAAPDITPPTSITNLANDTTTCEQITFSWTNPADADYNGSEWWWNGVQQANLTSAATFVMLGGLTGGVPQTISTKTFDTSGNLNSTFVNMTAMAESCATPTTTVTTTPPTTITTTTATTSPTPTSTPTPAILHANFISNVTCGNVPFNVLFTSTSAGLNITDYYWDFGEGNTSILNITTNTYGTPGMYPVYHSVTDDTMNVSWDNRTAYIRTVPDWAICPMPSGGPIDDPLIYGIIGGLIGGIGGSMYFIRRKK